MENMDSLVTAGGEEMMDPNDDDVDDEEEIRLLDALEKMIERDEQEEREEREKRERENLFGTPGGTLDHSSMSSSLTSRQSSSVSPYRPEQPEELAQPVDTISINDQSVEKPGQLEQIRKECRKRPQDTNMKSTADNEETEDFDYINCGRPYFRDSNNELAPDNSDTIKMKAMKFYDFSSMPSVRGWTVDDKNQFENVMIKVSLEIKKESYNSKIMELERAKTKPREITTLRKERDSLSELPFSELAPPLDHEFDWNQLATQRLSRRHTPREYECFWKLYLHPSINKSSWNETEYKTLQVIAATNRYQDWDEIARQLNTGRTGYQCFVYFRTNRAPFEARQLNHGLATDDLPRALENAKNTLSAEEEIKKKRKKITKIQSVSDVIDVTEQQGTSKNVVVIELNAEEDVTEPVTKNMK